MDRPEEAVGWWCPSCEKIIDTNMAMAPLHHICDAGLDPAKQCSPSVMAKDPYVPTAEELRGDSWAYCYGQSVVIAPPEEPKK